MSKRDVLTALSTMNFNDVTVGDVTVTVEDFQDFIQTSLDQLDKRAEATRKKQAEKRQAGDQLRADIKAVLSEDPKTIPEIVDALNNPEVTSAMVVARISQLVKLGEVFRSEVRVDGRPIKRYSTVEVVTD